MDHRHIIFVPGKNPKPPPEKHRVLLWRALLNGVKRIDENCFEELQADPQCFSLIAWNFSYYHAHADNTSELPWIEQLMNKSGAEAEDVREAKNWHVRLNWLLYSIADVMPFIIRWLPGPACAMVNETRRYFNNKDNVADRVRAPLKTLLKELLADGKQVLLIGHSLGTVIAFDSLWELTHIENRRDKLDFLTLGSPLGMHFVQHRMLGHDRTGAEKYPANISRWINIAAVGDITALDNEFHDDFRPMLKLGLLDSITDYHKHVYTWYRNAAGLNVHRSYGYLVNDVVAKTIADWWKKNA